MRSYRIEKVKQLEHSFIENRRGWRVYAHYGKIKTYANRTQAVNRQAALALIGIKTVVSLSHPFVLIQEEQIAED